MPVLIRDNGSGSVASLAPASPGRPQGLGLPSSALCPEERAGSPPRPGQTGREAVQAWRGKRSSAELVRGWLALCVLLFLGRGTGQMAETRAWCALRLWGPVDPAKVLGWSDPAASRWAKGSEAGERSDPPRTGPGMGPGQALEWHAQGIPCLSEGTCQGSGHNPQSTLTAAGHCPFPTLMHQRRESRATPPSPCKSRGPAGMGGSVGLEFKLNPRGLLHKQK